jgi:hypothetical protein
MRRNEERSEREGQCENGMRKPDEAEEARQPPFVGGIWKQGSHEKILFSSLLGSWLSN